MDPEKQTVIKLLDEKKSYFEAIADSIWDHPELSL